MDLEELGIDVDMLKEYMPYAIYSLMIGAITLSLAQHHRILAVYCIVMATLIFIAFTWEVEL